MFVAILQFKIQKHLECPPAMVINDKEEGRDISDSQLDVFVLFTREIRFL